ncbi:lipopolysaccharide biosynthesis protein [Streptococcus hyovaginalis]|uniref:lipopolysaccharide biosynthesis protein n=1 Tax=Streptococcus hyovaginalis TaxID=149015 RepID=UPI0014789297|nr:hypothetical protein [Streptococcus hyovaginalis]
MAKWLQPEEYANFVIYISLFSILSNSLGNELGIVSQVLDNHIDFNKLLHKISFLSFFISFIALYLLHFQFFEILGLSVCVFFSNYRLYASGFFRKNSNFLKVFILNIYYLIGILIGLFCYYHFTVIWVPMIFAELISFIYVYKNSDIFDGGKASLSRKTLRIFYSFSFISFLNNLITYLDKVIIYPILGPLAVNVYYSTTTMSKIVNMVINPLHGVLLTWIKKDSNTNNLIKKFILASIPIMIVSILLSIPFTFLAMKILYSQYLTQSIKVILPVSLALGVSVGIAFLKSLLLKFVDSNILIKIYLLYFGIFILLSLVLSHYFGLTGFCYSVFISKCILLLEFIVNLSKCKEVSS